MRFITLAAAVGLASAPLSAAVPVVGQAANGNIFYLNNGQRLSVEDLKGMVVVVTYWVQDCKACSDQLQLLDYYRKSMPNVGLVPLAASADENGRVGLYRATKGTGVHGVKEIKGWLEPMPAAPTTYIIDRAGKVRYAGTGVMTIAKMNELLVPILREPQPAM